MTVYVISIDDTSRMVYAIVPINTFLISSPFFVWIINKGKHLDRHYSKWREDPVPFITRYNCNPSSSLWWDCITVAIAVPFSISCCLSSAAVRKPMANNTTAQLQPQHRPSATTLITLTHTTASFPHIRADLAPLRWSRGGSKIRLVRSALFPFKGFTRDGFAVSGLRYADRWAVQEKS